MVGETAAVEVAALDADAVADHPAARHAGPVTPDPAPVLRNLQPPDPPHAPAPGVSLAAQVTPAALVRANLPPPPSRHPVLLCQPLPARNLRNQTPRLYCSSFQSVHCVAVRFHGSIDIITGVEQYAFIVTELSVTENRNVFSFYIVSLFWSKLQN